MQKKTANDTGAVADPDIMRAGAADSGQDSGHTTASKVPEPSWTGIRGQHIRNVVLEAKRILREEGYIVGMIRELEMPFDLVGMRDGESILLKAALATKRPITNAREAARHYYHDIKSMQPFWKSELDNLQFWLFSKVAEPLRYRVYRGGIWNEATRKAPELPEPHLELLNLQMRSAACSAVPAGLANGPD